MVRNLFKSWWALVLRGVLAILFGILAFLNPGAAMLTLVLWLGIFLLIDGILALVSAFANWKTTEDKWMIVLEGALTLFLGILIVMAPGAYSVFLVILLGIWAIFAGAMRIAMAIQVRKEIKGEGWIMAGGALAILFGVLIIAQPDIGIASLIYLIATFAILVGIVFVVIGLKMRKVGGKLQTLAAKGKDAIGKMREKGGSIPPLKES